MLLMPTSVGALPSVLTYYFCYYILVHTDIIELVCWLITWQSVTCNIKSMMAIINRWLFSENSVFCGPRRRIVWKFIRSNSMEKRNMQQKFWSIYWGELNKKSRNYLIFTSTVICGNKRDRIDQDTISHGALLIDNFVTFYWIDPISCSRSSRHISLCYKTWSDKFQNTTAGNAKTTFS